MLLEVLGIGLIIGWLRRGSLKNLWQIKLHGLNSIGIALVLTAVVVNSGFLGLDRYPVLISTLYLLSFVALLIGLAKNVHLPGARLALLGAALNFVVIISNGCKMPVTPEMFTWITPESFAQSTQSLTHQVLTSATRLPFLADIIVLPPGFPLAGIYSIGDLLLYAGIIWVVQAQMRLNCEGQVEVI